MHRSKNEIRNLFISFIWVIFLCLLNLPPCVCFCVIGRAALTPCIIRVAYFRKGTHKLCGVEPQIITRMGQPATQFCVSVWGEGAGRGQCHHLASGRFAEHWPHFQSLHLLPVTDTLPVVALVMNLRVRWVCLCSNSMQAL